MPRVAEMCLILTEDCAQEITREMQAAQSDGRLAKLTDLHLRGSDDRLQAFLRSRMRLLNGGIYRKAVAEDLVATLQVVAEDDEILVSASTVVGKIVAFKWDAFAAEVFLIGLDDHFGPRSAEDP